jgi:hypothetical protein
LSNEIDYPYLTQALRYWEIFDAYVRGYIEAYYPTEDALQRDPHPRLWYEALDHHLVRGVRGYVPELTRDALSRLCTVLMYSASVAHTENSLAKYLGFMETTVHADGTHQTVGEVQDTIHFLLLTATPMTFLAADHSHVALDARGAEIMRGFRRNLEALQREMAAQPSRHWQLFPSEIEASVSC